MVNLYSRISLFLLGSFLIVSCGLAQSDTPPTTTSGTNVPSNNSSAATPTSANKDQKDNTAWDAGTNPTPTLDRAEFKWWAPEVKTLRGVLVILPGRNGDARNAVNDSEWRELAEKEAIAIVGCRLVKLPKGDYQLDRTGKVAAVINKAVSTLAAANGHPYLKEPPLAFWGMSAGGNTAACYADVSPRRVIAIADIKAPDGSGGYNTDKGSIPWLVNVGKADKPDWVKSSMENYQKGQKQKALWTLALHPSDGHTERGTKPMAIAFLTAAIEQRLGSSSQTTSSGTLKHISFYSGWLGDPVTYDIAPYDSFHGRKSEAIWLINEETAQAWQEYLKAK